MQEFLTRNVRLFLSGKAGCLKLRATTSRPWWSKKVAGSSSNYGDLLAFTKLLTFFGERNILPLFSLEG
jgi:hypothetical protein